MTAILIALQQELKNPSDRLHEEIELYKEVLFTYA